MKLGDSIKIKHPKPGEMDGIVIRENKHTIEVMTLDGPALIGKDKVIK